MRRLLLTVLLVLSLSAASFGQAANQNLNFNTMQSLINAGTFIQNNNGCNFTGLQLTTHNTFAFCISNNGACAGTLLYLMTYQDMLNCRVLHTIHSATIGKVETTVGVVGISDATHQIGVAGTGASTHCEFGVRLNGGPFIIDTVGDALYSGGATGTISVVAFDSGGVCSVGAFPAVTWYD